jgi:hypothetical protein
MVILRATYLHTFTLCFFSFILHISLYSFQGALLEVGCEMFEIGLKNGFAA